MIYVIFFLAIIVFWLLGGQFGSAWRKYGCGVTIAALVIWRTVALHASGGIWWAYLPLLGVWPVLFLGYGEKSWFMKVFLYDWAVRVADAVALWLCIGVVAALLGMWLWCAWSLLILIAAFQVRLGAFKIGKKDFIWDDLTRSAALATALFGVLL